MNAIQERLTFVGPTARYRPHADGFGVVTSTRECGRTVGILPRIGIAMIRNTTISSIGLSVLAATMFMAAPAFAGVPSALGLMNYKGSSAVGPQQITVNVIPAPGALALLGVAGLIGGRRRRA